MVDRKIGSAVVVDQGQIVGIFTASDAMRALVEAFGGTVAPAWRAPTIASARPASTSRRRNARRKSSP
jgi:CBS domain-containing protein